MEKGLFGGILVVETPIMKNIFTLLFALFTIVCNAQLGSVCTNAESIDNDLVYTTSATYTTIFDDHWYVFTPDSGGMHTISTCDLANCDTKIWIYESCLSTVTEFAEGTFSYNDDYCGLQSSITVNLIAGNTYYIRIGDYSDACVDVLNWNLSFMGQIAGCTDPAACNFNPSATTDDGSCAYYPSPFCSQPDLEFDSLALVNSLYLSQHFSDECDIQEGCVTGYGNRWVLAFSAKINNVGEEDYYLGNPNSNPGMFTTQNCHGHTHYEGYGDYRLMDVNGNIIPAGHKNGFCVMDLCGAGQYNCGDMGISAGCYDIYGAGTQCQWVDLTNVPAGQYRLMAIVNPEYLPDALGRIETNNENNAANVCLDIQWNNGVPEFQVLAECTQYYDCTGELNGSATMDCMGECDGPHLFADMNADTTLNNVDLGLFMQQMADEALAATPCNDLNGNGNLTVYDLALAQNCMLNQNNGTIWNNDCQFPQDLINPNSSAGMAIANADITNGWVDIEIKNFNQNLTAFQFQMSGIHITNVLPIYPGITNVMTDFNDNNQVYFLCDGLTDIAMSTVPNAFCRVFFDVTTSTTICIDEIVDVVNDQYERVPSYIYGNCVSVTNGVQSWVANEQLIEIYNNPVRESLNFNIQAAGFEGNNWIQIFDMKGRQVLNTQLNGRQHQLDVSDWSAGAYQMQVVGENNVRLVQSWVKE